MKIDLGLTVFLLWYLDGIFFAESSNSTEINDFEPETTTTAKVLSRRRRYIVFPKGSSLQLLLELLTHVPTGIEIVLGPTLQIAWPLPSEPLRKSVNTKPKSLNHINYNLLENHVTHFKKFLGFESKKSSEEWPASRKYKLFSGLEALLNLFGMTVGLAWQLPDDPMIYSDFKKKHKIYKRNAFKKLEAFMRPGGADGKHCVLRALCESGQRTPSKKNFVQEMLHKIFSVPDDLEDEEAEEDKIYAIAHRTRTKSCSLLYPKCEFSVFGFHDVN